MTRLEDSPRTDDRPDDRSAGGASVAVADRADASPAARATPEAPRRDSATGEVISATTAAVQAVMSHRQILFVIFGLMSGMFLGALDQTVVGTSIRTIADDLHGLDQQAWVTTAYLIMSTIATPIYGKLSDLFGRRPLFLFAIGVFVLGSVLSTLAGSMYELAAFRAVQGLGAGGLMSLPLTIMGDMLAPRERAKYQGYFLAVFGISSVIGPLVGGLFAGADQILFITGWRWVFLVNVPIGAFAIFMVVRFLHLPAQEKHDRPRIDWWGAAFVIVALVPLLLVAEQGRDWGWASPGALALYVLGGLGAIAFVVTERKMGDAAIIPLKLFRSSTFSMATLLGVLVGFGMFGALLTIPLYLQLVKGATPTQSGFLMIPMIGGMMVASITSGQVIARTGHYRIFPITGTAFMTAGFAWMTFLTMDRPIWFLSVGMVMLGLGLGQLMQTLTIASQNSVGTRDMGVATSASTFFRQIGGTLGTAVLFSVLFTRIPTTIKNAFQDPTLQQNLQNALRDPSVVTAPKNHRIVELLQSAQSGGSGKLQDSLNGDTSFLNSATHALAAPFLTGFSNAAVSVFWVALGVLVVAFVLSLFFKTPPLRAKSALQEQADSAAAAQRAAVQGGTETAVVPGVGAAGATGIVTDAGDAGAQAEQRREEQADGDGARDAEPGSAVASGRDTGTATTSDASTGAGSASAQGAGTGTGTASASDASTGSASGDRAPGRRAHAGAVLDAPAHHGAHDASRAGRPTGRRSAHAAPVDSPASIAASTDTHPGAHDATVSAPRQGEAAGAGSTASADAGAVPAAGASLAAGAGSASVPAGAVSMPAQASGRHQTTPAVADTDPTATAASTSASDASTQAPRGRHRA